MNDRADLPPAILEYVVYAFPFFDFASPYLFATTPLFTLYHRWKRIGNE